MSGRDTQSSTPQTDAWRVRLALRRIDSQSTKRIGALHWPYSRREFRVHAASTNRPFEISVGHAPASPSCIVDRRCILQARALFWCRHVRHWLYLDPVCLIQISPCIRQGMDRLCEVFEGDLRLFQFRAVDRRLSIRGSTPRGR